jgi:hypothetical protein
MYLWGRIVDFELYLCEELWLAGLKFWEFGRDGKKDHYPGAYEITSDGKF